MPNVFIITEPKQHWIVRVEDSFNKYKVVTSGYFDGTEQDAVAYFMYDTEFIAPYIGKSRYQITMAANPVVLQSV